jgi:DNA-binding transcriptional MerR regulator
LSEKVYLSTGELAKMLGVTKQTVIYYDNIGLISPAKKDDKDYRYYTLEQADELDSIITFRELGVSISVLREYLSERNVQRCIEMLRKQEQNVIQEIKKLDRIQKKIEARASLLEEVADVKDLYRVEFSEQKQEYYMVETCTQHDEKSYMQSFISLCNHSKKLHIEFENPICNIIKKEDLVSGDFNKVSSFGIKIPDDYREYSIEWQEKPQGIYASTYHQGHYEMMHRTYERLLNSIREEGYVICGNAYELDLFSTLTSLDKDEYMKHISIQVCRA